MDPHPSPPRLAAFSFYICLVCVCVCVFVLLSMSCFGVLDCLSFLCFLSFRFLSFDLISGLLLQYCFTTSPRCFAIFLPLPTRSPHSVCLIPFFFFSILFLYSFLFCLFIFLFSTSFILVFYILLRFFLFSRVFLFFFFRDVLYVIYYLKVKFFFLFLLKYSRI